MRRKWNPPPQSPVFPAMPPYDGPTFAGWPGNITTDVSRLRIVVDCANGAAAEEAPELFRALGMQATFLHSAPDGQNINESVRRPASGNRRPAS